MIFKPDGTLVARFSDLADRNGGLIHGIFFLSSSVATESTDSNQFPDENRYETQVDLLPGEYELRVALSDGKKFGKAIVPLSIKSANHNELTISQISLCKSVSDVSVNGQRLPGTWTLQVPDYAPLVSNETEFQPTADTRFKLGESLYAYFEVYTPQGEGSENGGVEIEIRIVDPKVGEIINDPRPISIAPYAKAGSSTNRIGRGVDISGVPKGSYRIEIRAVDSSGRSTAWRKVDFAIE
jgi:hypothetical protein